MVKKKKKEERVKKERDKKPETLKNTQNCTRHQEAMQQSVAIIVLDLNPKQGRESPSHPIHRSSNEVRRGLWIMDCGQEEREKKPWECGSAITN